MQLGLGKGTQRRYEVHRRMIGARLARPRTWPSWQVGTLTGALAIVGAAAVFGLRSPESGIADPPRAHDVAGQTRAAATLTDDALVRMGDELTAALADARRGSAATLTGDASPAEPFLAAADRLSAGAATADEASSAIKRLAGMVAAASPGVARPALAFDGRELEGIAAQLRAVASAAEEFAERRRTADATIEALGRAVAALDGDRLPDAFTALAEARASLDVIRAWDVQLATLPVWIDTTAALIDAAEQLGRAAERGDEAAIAAAAETYRLAAEEGHQADLALGIAIAEGASAVAAAPLQRLTDALRDVAESRAAVASVLHPETSLAR